jgi:hypothetical protein
LSELDELLIRWRKELKEREDELERYIDYENCKLEILYKGITGLEYMRKMGKE